VCLRSWLDHRPHHEAPPSSVERSGEIKVRVAFGELGIGASDSKKIAAAMLAIRQCSCRLPGRQVLRLIAREFVGRVLWTCPKYADGDPSATKGTSGSGGLGPVGRALPPKS
jgi:hypothetical protein